MSDATMPAGWAWDDEMQTFWRLANFLDPADKGASITIDRMRELLATRGLALVPAADVVTPEERAVLDGMARVSWRGLHNPRTYGDDLGEACEGELARRAAKSDSAEWAMMRARLLDESRVPTADPNRVTDHDADQRPHPYGPSSEDSADSSLLSAPAAGATFHKQVAEALGLMDGDNGSYVYADEATCLTEVMSNRSEASLWRDYVQRRDEQSGLEEPEACGCEQSDDLKDKLTECRRLLRAIHGFAKSITELSGEVP